MIFDHIGLTVSDAKRSVDFYTQALAPLGITVVAEVEGWYGMGTDRPVFWFGEGEGAGLPMHIALSAKSAQAVRDFHAAALAAGAKDNGAPGLRIYHPNYYGAFVIDPDGNNIEAVFHGGDTP